MIIRMKAAAPYNPVAADLHTNKYRRRRVVRNKKVYNRAAAKRNQNSGD